ncbi:MAG: hypothetical protein MO852_02420 [Candidatus Devosia euplotis]|nr:hypothetical protein [Candidatus Devosia euplotis]
MEVWPAAVVIDAGFEVVAANVVPQGMGRQTQRIDRGKNGEMAVEMPGGICIVRPGQQMVQDHGAGLLIGMQRRLKVGAGGGAGAPPCTDRAWRQNRACPRSALCDAAQGLL